MHDDALGWLLTCPPHDGNFHSALARATETEIRSAIRRKRDVPQNKGRITALERELRRRGLRP